MQPAPPKLRLRKTASRGVHTREKGKDLVFTTWTWPVRLVGFTRTK